MKSKVSWWTWLSSYFYEIVLESAHSLQHEELDVSIYKGQYRLNTKNAIYSWGDKYKNFSGAFKKIGLKKRSPSNVLVLGLGLGSIPYMIEKKYSLTPHFTLVEHDEVIIELANHYILENLKSSFDCICTDAEVFMFNNTQTYDLICMDIFIDNAIPEQFQTKSFLHDLKKALSPQGHLVFNSLAETQDDQTHAQWFFDEIFKSIFPSAVLYHIHYNYMLVATTNKEKTKG